LLILGEKSHSHFASIIDVLAVNLPRATRLTLAGADHSTLLEPSETLLSAVREFLSTPVPIP
jgi:pimeloyl-ACP methyl ester carboxylesterase